MTHIIIIAIDKKPRYSLIAIIITCMSNRLEAHYDHYAGYNDGRLIYYYFKWKFPPENDLKSN